MHRQPSSASRRRLRPLLAALVAVTAGWGVVVPGSSVSAVTPPCGILQGSAHVVTTPAELAQVGRGSTECRLSDDYVLGADITLPNQQASQNWTPIGDNAAPFTGTFDGDGHSINGLYFDDQTQGVNEKGLFGVTRSGAEVRDVTVSGYVRADGWVGGLIGAAYDTTVSGAVAHVDVSGTNVVGGLIGQAHDSQIIGSAAHGTVDNTSGIDGHYGTGGLIGVAERVSITGSLATGDVTAVKYDQANPGVELGRSSSAGGLVGDSNSWVTISASSATGDVTGGSFVGGLAGYIEYDGAATIAPSTSDQRMVTDVSATGRVDGVTAVGGLIGWFTGDATMRRATASGDVVATAGSPANADRSTGGLIGWAAGFAPADGMGPKLLVSDVSASGDVVADGEYVGGLIAGIEEVDITNARATGSLVEGGNKTGGLVGWMNLSSIVRSVAQADVSGSATSIRVGGLIGEAVGTSSAESLISESAAYGDVSGQAGVGGLVGYNGGWTNVERSFALGAVSGNLKVGGLVGEVYDIDVVDSFARGAVTADDAKAGALAGWFEDVTGGTSSISRSYASGAVFDTDPTNGDNSAAPGGLVVDNPVNTTTSVMAPVTASYWDATVSGVLWSTKGGDPKSTVDLTAHSTFLAAGWAIVDGWAPSNPPADVWGICPAVNDGYPFLLWAYPTDQCSSGALLPPPPPAFAEQTESGGVLLESSFTPVVPRRLVDTRNGVRLGAGDVLEVPVPVGSGVPADATAVAVNLTVVDPVGTGFVTVFPCGTARPMASTLNFVTASTVANAATVALGSTRTLCVFTSNPTDVIVDLAGFWSPSGSGRFTAVAPTRVLDTRDGAGRVHAGSTTELDVSAVVPAGASAVALNVTAVDAAGNGFVTVFPCGSARPMASNLNVSARSTVPVSVIAGRGSGGRVCVFASAPMDVVVDVTGWFGAGASTRMVSAVPTRLLDTRHAGARAAADTVTRVPVSAGASAVVLNVTAVDPSATSFVTVYPCGTTRPTASTLNVTAGRTRANQVLVGAAGGEVCVYTQSATHLVIDQTAAFAG